MIRTLLLAIARNKTLTSYFARKGMETGFALRFVAGEKLEDAIRAVREFNQRSLSCSLNLLGEHVQDRPAAEHACATYIRALDAISGGRVDSNVSLKLTQLGLDIDADLCRRNLDQVLEQARRHGIFVRIDMESSAYTDRTLQFHGAARSRYDNVGTVIQSCLYRSGEDVRDLIAQGARVRLCKGAYLEPREVAYPRKADVDAAYRQLSERLLAEGTYPALATHDDAMIDHAREYAERNGISKERFEFQMILGVRRDLQTALRTEGYNVRVYIPFGREWLPYFMRRLAERPANMLFVLRGALRERRAR